MVLLCSCLPVLLHSPAPTVLHLFPGSLCHGIETPARACGSAAEAKMSAPSPTSNFQPPLKRADRPISVWATDATSCLSDGLCSFSGIFLATIFQDNVSSHLAALHLSATCVLLLSRTGFWALRWESTSPVLNFGASWGEVIVPH